MRSRIVGSLFCLSLAASVGPALAVPIVYDGTLLPGATVAGTITSPIFFDDAVGADYWRFSAVAGQTVNIIGRRQDGVYDMAFWVYRGEFTNTNQFGDPASPGFFSFDDPDLINFYDDIVPANLPGGLFGDPQAIFVAPVTGVYTIAVTSGASLGGPPYDYTLSSIPEPATMIMIGTGLAALAAAARRRRR